MPATDAVIELRDAEVHFGHFRALKGVDLSIHRNEVVGLLGENGAGKSTLIKVLAGVNSLAKGTMLIDGHAVELADPHDAIARGIATVHQHSMLVGTMTVAENLVLGNESEVAGGPFITPAQVRRRAKEICSALDVELPLASRVEDLSLPERQRVEIVRAAVRATSLLILDEPTAALEPEEVSDLFDTIRTLREKGIPVLYISHRLEEIPQICDRVVVLRDGLEVGRLKGDECTTERIVPLIAGRELDDLYPNFVGPSQDATAVITDVRATSNMLAPHSLTIRSGEIVGLTGTMGAGQTEFARSIAGVEDRTGTVVVDGAQLSVGSVSDAVDKGVAYVSGDRSVSVFPEMPVWQNAAVGSWNRLTNRIGAILKGKERKRGKEICETYDVRASSLDAPITDLSGGNQQKVLVGRWAATEPKLMVLDEPTLGVDVGSRREIYDQLAALVARGMALLVVSSDYEELRGISDRVLVFRAGRVVAELDSSEATNERILAERYAGGDNV